MISRVAEACFWLHRYIERVEVMARMLDVNHSFQLDADLSAAERWRPLIVVTGQEDHYLETVAADEVDDPETAQDYLVWNRDNPSSVFASVGGARNNARTIRETISLEMWESLNRLWLWLDQREARRLWERDRHGFYMHLRDQCLLFHGLAEATMLHDEPFWFMRLGTTLERASLTARILDVKYHSLGPSADEIESPEEAAQWLATLRFCSAIEPFFKRDVDNLSGRAVAEFLLFDPEFPRSVACTLRRSRDLLGLIRTESGEDGQPGEIGADVQARLEEMIRRLATDDRDETVLKLHDVLTWIVSTVANLCEDLHGAFFDPAPRPLRSRSSQSQTQG